MKRLVLILALLNIGFLQAVLVKLPNAEILTERLNAKGFDHLIEKTDLVNQLADREVETAGVMTAVNLAVLDYSISINNPNITVLMDCAQPMIVKTILQDSPNALKEAVKLEKKLELYLECPLSNNYPLKPSAQEKKLKKESLSSKIPAKKVIIPSRKPSKAIKPNAATAKGYEKDNKQTKNGWPARVMKAGQMDTPLSLEELAARDKRRKEFLYGNSAAKSPEDVEKHLAIVLDEYMDEVRSWIGNDIERSKKIMAVSPVLLEGQILEEQAYAPSFDCDKFCKDIYDGFRGLSSIAIIFGHDNTAYRLFTIGGASFEAIKSINSFAENGLNCGINPYVGILCAVASISTLFRKKEKDNSAQVILNAINNGIMHLSQQIYQFQKNVLQNFENLHKNLNRHHLIMLEKFGALHLDQENFNQNLENFSEYVKDNHVSIQNGIDALSKQANSNFRMTLDNLTGLRIEEIDDLIERSLLALKREDISAEEFGRYIEELYVKGISRASADALTGGSVDIHSLNSIQTMLEGPIGQQNVFAHPAFANINLLSKYVESTSEDFKHEKLVNPIIWIKCVEALLYLIDQKIDQDAFYPSSKKMKSLDIDKLMMLKEQGEKIIKFIEKLGKNEYLKKIAEDYESRLQELSDAIRQEQSGYEEKRNQKLCRKHRIHIEQEKAKIDRFSNADECKKCVENITNSLNAAAKARQIRKRGASTYLQVLGRFYIKGALNNIDIFDSQLKRDRTALDIHNPTEKFKKLWIEHQNIIRAKEANVLNSVKLDLTQSSFNPIGDGIALWAHPNDIDLPLLILPKQKLPIDPIFFIAENKGIGYITHKYTVTDKDFHFESFFNFKEDKRKIKILHLRKPHDFLEKKHNANSDKYSDIENVNHFWYGGSYPKETIDTFSFPATPLYRLGALDKGYYPPEKPYAAEKDIFVSTARREKDEAAQYRQEVNDCIQNSQNEKRLEFNQEVINNILSHGTTSSIFKAAQRLDVCFKLLDSLLTIMYNDVIHETHNVLYTQFSAIKSREDDKCIKDLASMTSYVQNYSQKHNPEHKQGNYLPFYITKTTEKLSRALNAIIGSDCKVGFNHVSRVIDNIGLVVAKYRMRNITPRILAPKVTISTELTETSGENIAYLVESNRLLIQEVNGLKNQIATMQYQFTNTMNLVLAKLGEKNLPRANKRIVDITEDDDHDDFDDTKSFDNDSEETKLEQLLSYNYSEESDYMTSIKKVARQVDAECGYHALFNGLKCFDKKLSLSKLIPCFKKQIAKKRNQIDDDQWLSEDELSGLVAECKGMNAVTLIGDISMYYDGITGLERSTLEELALAQQAIQLGENYQHVFILGTMDARNNQRFAHWIAVELVVDEGKVNYSIMDSLQSSHIAQQVEKLQAILHIKEERFAINILENEDTEERISDYISQLSLADIFKEGKRCYALTGERTHDCPIIVNKKPKILIDSIINAAVNLISEVQETSFWSTEGYIQPYVRISNALKYIKDCDQQDFVCKENSCDFMPDILPILELTFEQKEQIEMIETSILI